jgi:peptidyl-prolyl cis-trans isomerase C
MSWRTTCVVAVAVLALLALGGCGGHHENVLARVGRVNITDKDLQARFEQLPSYARQQFATPEGMIDLLNRLVEEEVLYQAAIDDGYDRDPEVERTVDSVRRRAMIQAFYKDKIEAGVEVPEDDIVAYYNDHADQYQRLGRVRFRVVETHTRQEAERARERVLAGESIATVARDMSVDPLTRPSGGLAAPVHMGEGVPKLGMDADFVKSLFDLKVGEVSDALQTSQGWVVLQLQEKVEPGERPLDEVRDQIEHNLLPGKVREHYDEVYAQLKERFRTSINETALRPKPRTEEELFTLAQQTEDPLERLNDYAELVFNYPEGEHAAEAQFMIGFIYSEELHQDEQARAAFEKMIRDYPNSELVDSAKWMLANMGKETPELQEGTPDSTK